MSEEDKPANTLPTFTPYRRLAGQGGILRGVSHGDVPYPIFHDSWKGNCATHEVWTGQSGCGKTFALNGYLMREYAENGVPFDLLEPVGSGKLLAQALKAECYNLNSRTTVLNPQDVMFDSVHDQVAHSIRLYETILGRPLSGGQVEKIQRALLGEALLIAYQGFKDIAKVTPDLAPRTDFVLDILSGLGVPKHPQAQRIAHDLADEIGRICTGSGPWARFLNGETNVDFSRAGRKGILPRVFSFRDMSADGILQAIAYVQVLSAIRRDSLIDEQPRIIALEEVYRLMRYPALLDFLVEAMPVFRTRRKKVILVDQNLSIFLRDDKTRFLLENCPTRVIFQHSMGTKVFEQDPAFRHLNAVHLDILRFMPRYSYLLEVEGQLHYLCNRPANIEVALFGST